MKTCLECYSEDSRKTPLLRPRECLEQHLQYCCGTCGQCICIEKDSVRGLQRWNFPFKVLEKAKLYLRTADVTASKACAIYKLCNDKDRVSYKIFEDKQKLEEYLLRNKTKHCASMKPIFQAEMFIEYPNTKIKILTKKEVQQYLDEQSLTINRRKEQ